MATTVIKLEIVPKWARMDILFAITGIPDNTVRELVNNHKVRARVCRDADMPEKVKMAAVFNVQDALDWLEEEAEKPPRYKVGEQVTKG